MTSLVSHVVLL